MTLRSRSRATLLLLGLLVCLAGGSAGAKDLTLDEAVSHALQNNRELVQLRLDIETIERNMEKIRAGQGWQADLEITYERDLWGEQISGEGASSDSTEKPDIALGLKRSYPFGLTITPKIKARVDDREHEVSVEASQQLFPWIPPESEQTYFTLKKDLEKAERKLERTSSDKVVYWVETYLELIRLQEQYELSVSKKELAERNLRTITASHEIGEASEQQVLDAKVSVKQAEYTLAEVGSEYEQKKAAFYDELGLLADDEVVFSAGSEFIERIRSTLESSVGDLTDTAMMDLCEETDYELFANRVTAEVLMKELEWLKAEAKPKVTANGTYDVDSGQFRVGINLSYSLWNGGQNKLDVQEKLQQVSENDRAYDRLRRSAELELEELTSRTELDKLVVEQEAMNLEAARLDEKATREQWVAGVVDETTLESKQLKTKEAELSLRAAEDALFVSKLRLMNFVQPAEFN